MPLNLHVNPKTETPYGELNHFTFIDLSKDIQELYTWVVSSQRYVYIGRKEEKTNDTDAL